MTTEVYCHNSIGHCLTNDKILDMSQLKAFADNNSNVLPLKLKLVLGKVEKILGRAENSGLQAFSSFPTMFSKDFHLMVKKSPVCVVLS